MIMDNLIISILDPALQLQMFSQEKLKLSDVITGIETYEARKQDVKVIEESHAAKNRYQVDAISYGTQKDVFKPRPNSPHRNSARRHNRQHHRDSRDVSPTSAHPRYGWRQDDRYGDEHNDRSRDEGEWTPRGREESSSSDETPYVSYSRTPKWHRSPIPPRRGNSPSPSRQYHHPNEPRRQEQRFSSNFNTCEFCGYRNHTIENCRFRIRHEKGQTANSKNRQVTSFYVSSNRIQGGKEDTRGNWMQTVIINDKIEVEFKLDTAAEINLIKTSVVKKLGLLHQSKP